MIDNTRLWEVTAALYKHNPDKDWQGAPHPLAEAIVGQGPRARLAAEQARSLIALGLA